MLREGSCDLCSGWAVVWVVLFFHVLLELTLLGQFVERSGVPCRAEGARVEPAAAAGSLLLPPLPGQR